MKQIEEPARKVPVLAETCRDVSYVLSSILSGFAPSQTTLPLIGSRSSFRSIHVVVLSRRHLVELVNSYLRYYHEDRCHLGLQTLLRHGVGPLEVFGIT